jgi:hypothetical protein
MEKQSFSPKINHEIKFFLNLIVQILKQLACKSFHYELYLPSNEGGGAR